MTSASPARCGTGWSRAVCSEQPTDPRATTRTALCSAHHSEEYHGVHIVWQPRWKDPHVIYDDSWPAIVSVHAACRCTRVSRHQWSPGYHTSWRRESLTHTGTSSRGWHTRPLGAGGSRRPVLTLSEEIADAQRRCEVAALLAFYTMLYRAWIGWEDRMGSAVFR